MIIVSGVVIEQNKFPDNTLLMKFDPNGDEFDSRGNLLVKWYYENDAELFSLICVKRHLDRIYSHGDVVLYMPYIPHARMDRVKSDEDVFTLKYFCEVINSLNFKIIYVRDAHSNVSLALLNNVFDEGVNYYIKNAITLSKVDALFFPDEGAMKRYSGYFDKPYAFGMKKRDWQTGKILGLDIANSENIADKNILIVDDICSRGGTFYHSAKALKEAGAKDIYLYITHAENTMVDGEMYNSDLIKHIYTTNSIFDKNKDFKKLVTIYE